MVYFEQKEGKGFFFKKRNQKTFTHLEWHRHHIGRRITGKSLFASFSSEKEDPSFP
jgi:hypothetical protein